MAGAQAQINVRIDPEVKAAGDRVIESLGLSTSEVVRMLWSKLAQGEQEGQKVLACLSQEPATERKKEVDRKLAALDGIDEGWQQFANYVGLNLSDFKPMTDDELAADRHAYLIEKYGV